MDEPGRPGAVVVTCRIGSSETMIRGRIIDAKVTCRIGSSENTGGVTCQYRAVTCRIGSSEIVTV